MEYDELELDTLGEEKQCSVSRTFFTGTPIITGYLRSQMPILRCLCRTASQDYVVLFCFFGVRLIRICKIIYINTIILGIPNRFISSATIMLNIAYNEV